MSYLPRMSSTYKEPQAIAEDDTEEIKPTSSIQPASSLASEKTYSPQTALKHYKYHPHPPPVLPGPSVVDEANENELLRESSKIKRSASVINDIIHGPSKISLNFKTVDSSESSIVNSKAVPSQIDLLPTSDSNHNTENMSKVSHKKQKKHISDSDKKKNTSNQTINICLVKTEVPKSFVAPQNLKTTSNNEVSSSKFLNKMELNSSQDKDIVPANFSLNPFKDTSQTIKSSRKDSKNIVHREVQCTIFGCADKIFVIPMIIKSLLKAMTFILHEINKDEVLNSISTEGKRIMTQIQIMLENLCNQNIEENFRFDVTYSDIKRTEKLLEGLQNYLKSTYGTDGDFLNLTEKLKKFFFILKVKELELSLLNEQVQESETFRKTEVDIKESDLKNPDVTLQNHKLESEQLLAQLEFSKIEIKKCHKALAEADWEIKNGNDRVKNIKKVLGSKSKIDNLRRKSSVQKIFLDSPKKSARTRNLEDVRQKI